MCSQGQGRPRGLHLWCLHWQFLCNVLKALFFIKIAQPLSYFCQKMQYFRALGAPPPDPQAQPPPIANFWQRV